MTAMLAVVGATAYGVQQGFADDTGRVRAARDEPAVTWAIMPSVAGTDLPPAGRSLFDAVVSGGRDGKPGYDIPFPLPALLRRLEERAGCRPAEVSSAASCVKAVLIPLGRSLQRTAAAPDFFVYPRVVVAVTGEPETSGRDQSATRLTARPLLKDRIYLGYQERANLIEVISYNDAAGRFEFQVVKDYAAGRTPRVLYANRMLCTTCHQNHAPIFSRPVWEETNANPAIAARLKASRKDFYGLKIDRGVDIPNAINDASDRANLYAVAQTLWRDGCADSANTSATEPVAAIRCRAALLKAALQYRLSGERGFAGSDELVRFAALATRRWNSGLAIGNPDIPNRNPLAVTATRGAPLAPAHVPARFEPLLRRPPLEVWYPTQTDFARRAVIGLAAFFAEADIDELDARLYRHGAPPHMPRAQFATDCRFARSAGRTTFACAGEALRVSGEWRADGGHVRQLQVGDLPDAGAFQLERAHGPMAALDGVSARGVFRAVRDGRHVRLADGRAIELIELRKPAGPGDNGGITVTLLEDYDVIATALNDMTAANANGKSDELSDRPFRRGVILPALLTRLGVDYQPCCADDRRLPPPRVDNIADDPVASAALAQAGEETRKFFSYCAGCHQSHDAFPPNFLYGSASQVAANLRQCAERIYFRLSMWQVTETERPKTPMPPALALDRLRLPSEQWATSPDLAAMTSYIAEVLHADGRPVPTPAQMVVKDYETMKPCFTGH